MNITDTATEFIDRRQTEEHGLLAPIAMPFHLPTPIYGAMLAIWHLRPRLQRRFPLYKGRAKDFVRFLAWCAIEGRRQYTILQSIPEWDAALARPIILPRLSNDLWSGGFSVAMFFYGVARYRYFTAPMLKDVKARHRIARAFWRGERHKFVLPPLSSWQIEYMGGKFNTNESLIATLRLNRKDAGKTLQRLIEEFGLSDVLQCLKESSDDAIHSAEKISRFPWNEVTSNLGNVASIRPELHKTQIPRPPGERRNPDNTQTSGMPASAKLADGLVSGRAVSSEVKQATLGISCTPFKVPEEALLPIGLSRFYLRLPIRVLRKLAWMGDRLRRRPTQFQLASVTNRISIGQRSLFRSSFTFGVNLFGYAQGEIGIGEDVRLLALALKSQNIPFCIVNVKPGDNVSQQDNSVDQWIVEKPRYAINIFCITGIEQIRYACEKGLDVFKGRYNIGFWPWELPEWPASCTHAFSMVDEIWGISRYTANAYRRAQRPVFAMSLPVTIDKVAPMERKDFGLPNEDYLFVFSFDFNSTLIRKNPIAVIHAFKKAFSYSKGDKVGLVLKASHVKASNKGWIRIKRLIDADPRIHLVDTTLRRPEVLALYKCCDCYVSLHRAEGFGRGLAEALILDLQLIATGFSGNIDFCTEERVGLVRYKRREVRRLEYFHADGQSWADPDIDHVAELMRSIRANPRPIEPRLFDFSPTTMGARYAQRIHEIKQQLNLTKASESLC